MVTPPRAWSNFPTSKIGVKIFLLRYVPQFPGITAVQLDRRLVAAGSLLTIRSQVSPMMFYLQVYSVFLQTASPRTVFISD